MFVRRYDSVQTADEITKVSGVVIVNNPTPGKSKAAKFGTICVVGEFEDGEFNEPTEILNSTSGFGGFGFQYSASVKYKYPCALRSGGSEYWNGNAWVQASKLAWGALIYVRADTSIGSVTLSPLAFVQGTKRGPFALTNGLTFKYSKNGGGAVTVTFAGTSASVTGTSGTFNSFVGGEVLTFSKSNESAIGVVFQASDTSISAIIQRINEAFGRTIASNSSGQLKLTDPKLGTGSAINITANAVSDELGLTSGSNVSATGTGDAVDLAATTYAEFKAKVETSGIRITRSANGYPRIVSLTPDTGTMRIADGTANSALGFTEQADAVTVATPRKTVLSAGIRISDGGADATRVVTMKSETVEKDSTAAVTLKVRPAVDDGSFTALSASSLDTLEDSPGDLEWLLTQPDSLVGALTPTQLDSVYLTAIASTLGPGVGTKKKIDGIVSARQSNAIRSALKDNAINATANGHNARRAFFCTPNGTTATVIISDAEPGVSQYRSKYSSMAVGAYKVKMQEMIDGGYADADGLIERHPDTFLASRWSVLKPGENPGQIPEEEKFRWAPTFVTGLDSEASTWDVDTYAALNAAGVCASVFDSVLGGSFEQGVTTVDPVTDPIDVTIQRVTFEGFFGNYLADSNKKDAKKQPTDQRVKRRLLAIESFLDQYVGKTVKSYGPIQKQDSGIEHVGLYDCPVYVLGSEDVIMFNVNVGVG